MASSASQDTNTDDMEKAVDVRQIADSNLTPSLNTGDRIPTGQHKIEFSYGPNDLVQTVLLVIFIGVVFTEITLIYHHLSVGCALLVAFGVSSVYFGSPRQTWVRNIASLNSVTSKFKLWCTLSGIQQGWASWSVEDINRDCELAIQEAAILAASSGIVMTCIQLYGNYYALHVVSFSTFNRLLHLSGEWFFVPSILEHDRSRKPVDENMQRLIGNDMIYFFLCLSYFCALRFNVLSLVWCFSYSIRVGFAFLHVMILWKMFLSWSLDNSRILASSRLVDIVLGFLQTALLTHRIHYEDKDRRFWGALRGYIFQVVLCGVVFFSFALGVFLFGEWRVFSGFGSDALTNVWWWFVGHVIFELAIHVPSLRADLHAVRYSEGEERV